MKWSDNKVLGLLAIWVVLITMFVSKDSYLYIQGIQFDSACFFMAGKALMNGLVPYVDFTDSKGILLWLIFGVGYLIDHYSYVGIFWMSCISIWITLSISYQTSRLWLNEKYSLFCSSLLIVPLLYWNFYFETKSEHFCWPAIAWGIYVLMRLESCKICDYRHFVWLGIGVLSCLMIKWSIAIMMLSFVCSIAWLSWSQGVFKKYLFGLSLGVALSFCPFAIYFTIEGIWQDMWQEYFVNTMNSVSLSFSETVSIYTTEWLGMITTKRFVYILYVVPAIVFWRKQNWFSSLFPVLCGLFFIALSIRHDQFNYYISVVGPFAILPIIVSVRYLLERRVSFGLMVSGGIISVIYIIWGAIYYSCSFCTKVDDESMRFLQISAAMSAVDHPKIIVLGQEKGLCMATSLPGTKYWITQLGRTESMWKEQKEAISKGTADFIICSWDAESKECIPIMESAGYTYFDNYCGKIYTKNVISKPENKREVSILDIVTKKNYLELYVE